MNTNNTTTKAAVPAYTNATRTSVTTMRTARPGSRGTARRIGMFVLPL
jgi:hypothetical protein